MISNMTSILERPVQAGAGIEALARLADRHRARGGAVVAVQGLGFVGAAVAAVVAGAVNAAGEARFLVIGIDRPTADGKAKAAAIEAGLSPIRSPDVELDRLTRDARKRDNLRATTDERAFSLADIVVVDVGLDVVELGSKDLRIDEAGFAAAIRAIGRHMRADALVILESTVPIGTSERVVAPLLAEERARRGIAGPAALAHAYERVTPGPRYVDSIRNFHRVFAGTTPEAAARARAFLSAVVDTQAYPLAELADTAASEMAKLLENSYRAVNIAFIHEWTLLAERAGVDLFAVIDVIRRRKGTHDNMRLPGFGVGGYCLPKDALLAQWAADSYFGGEVALDLTLRALDVNAAMPLHSFALTREVLDGALAGRKVAVLGISYIADVADTRNSPAAALVDELEAAGARVAAHDPVVETWPERPGHRVERELAAALRAADAVVLAVAHGAYRELTAEKLLNMSPSHAAFVDAANMLDDAQAAALVAAGRRVIGVGKGHWRRRGYHGAN
jgi:UDP-N-acetyl-D-glucosamine dehydrogenase